MRSTDSTAFSGILAGVALLVGGCSVSPAPTVETSPTTTAAAVVKPVATEGTPLADISAVDVSISPGYQEETGVTDAVARDAAQLGLDALKVFTADYAQYQKVSEALNQEELLALLPDAKQRFGPLMSEGALADLSERWAKGASDPNNLENKTLMLVTHSVDDAEDNSWENTADLKCGVSDAELTVTFSDPRVEAIPVDGADYKGTAFKTRAHYFVPCAEGPVLRQDMDWQLDLGADPENTRWQVYRWDRSPVGNAAVVQ